MAIGTIRLADGRNVKGFLVEPEVLRDARDITEYGGWRKYMAEKATG
jgi:allophanate hydrolase